MKPHSVWMAATLVLAMTVSASAGQREPARGGARQPSGGIGQAVPKGSGGGQGGSGGGQAGEPAPAARGREQGERRPGGTATGGTGESARRGAAPSSSRSPDDGVAIARAAPRAPRGSGGTTILIPGGSYGGFYPWGYGSYGFSGYYGGYYDPWFPGYGYGYGYPQRSYSDYSQLRIKVKPREATVFVDGYYAGRVDDFDGLFQRLHVEPGAHRIEMRADGYEALVLEVLTQPGRTLTYEGELRRLP